MVIQVGCNELENVPDTLEEFFDMFPSVCQANLDLTSMDHVNMWREQVLFMKQRQQATTDYRENQRVRWIGTAQRYTPWSVH
jgi:hypothetical protein